VKKGRMQCKDIPTEPILRLLQDNPTEMHKWWNGVDSWPSIRPAFPVDCPDHLLLAKMKQLIRKGLVFGCACGCRGDFQINSCPPDVTKKGRGSD
jgi:hypothetical protein